MTPELNKALCVAQGIMNNALKESDNPFFKSKYADLATVISCLKKPFADNGLSVTQTTRYENGVVILVTCLRHVSGEEVTSEYPIIPIKQDPQGMGSAYTYARRYSLQSIAGLAADDDDGNAASLSAAAKPAEKQKMSPQQMVAFKQRLSANYKRNINDVNFDLIKSNQDMIDGMTTKFDYTDTEAHKIIFDYMASCARGENV